MYLPVMDKLLTEHLTMMTALVEAIRLTEVKRHVSLIQYFHVSSNSIKLFLTSSGHIMKNSIMLYLDLEECIFLSAWLAV